MENEDGYMTLKPKNHLKVKDKSADFAWYPQCYCLMIIFGCVGILAFMTIIIGLDYQNKKMDFLQNVNSSNVAGSNFTCPNHWLLNQEKCYWFSTSFKTWKESQLDCKNQQAHLLVIQNLDELAFIQSKLKPGHFGWVGLYVTHQGNRWTWIDEHLLIPQLFPVIGPTDHNSCAVITGSQVYSEDCNCKFNSICQKDAVKFTSSNV
ncbi:PREDICTED: killer cell lectin-like receptor subfamily F member 2 [Elephantulus edwardii]|uniref:killer cell lectin-like receptor subfamily F member 2 n=1 Tax=Elephantulus edwardii TaxID=28737 RepID=UPI0003F06CA2|nr:PREDICTED: killer cell lectin-like receptor subfamily F member 2 [Elephantulus edwardii]